MITNKFEICVERTIVVVIANVMSYMVFMLSDASAMQLGSVECYCDNGQESSFW